MARLTSLDKYQLMKRIAVGGMSEIYLASQGGLSNFERAVIVKCIREDLDTEREVLDMFLDEARIAACLKHPNIVHLYDVGEDKQVPYLAMEYIFGRDLMQISERARSLGRELPIQFVLKVMCDALAGLHYAHETAEFEDRPLKVIHRDVSPQNILISFDGVTKVVDFGIAKAEARMSQTQAGILKGKYAYMSPEQVRGKPLDHRTDQFSLAIVFYEILTGTRLFQRDTDYSTMEAVDTCDIPPMKVLRRDVPRRLVKALRKATQKKPKKRFATCKEMERYLHKLLRGSGVEQTEFVASYVRTLFSNELQIRDEAIREAGAGEREIILSTGFEMLDDHATRIEPAPPAPIAHRRYEQILAERQKGGTAVKAAPMTDGDTPVRGGGQATAIKGPPALDPGGRRRANQQTARQGAGAEQGGLMSDWRILLLVFIAVMALALFIMDWLSGPEEVEVAPPPIGGPEAMSTTARPGLDGFLSVAVRHTVEIKLDGKPMGMGSFRKKPVENGIHKVTLKEGSKTQTITIRVKVNEEEFVAPVDWQ